MHNLLFSVLAIAALCGAPGVDYLEGVNKTADGSGVILYDSSVEAVNPDFDYISYRYTLAGAGEIVYTVLVTDGTEDGQRLRMDRTKAGRVTFQR